MHVTTYPSLELTQGSDLYSRLKFLAELDSKHSCCHGEVLREVKVHA